MGGDVDGATSAYVKDTQVVKPTDMIAIADVRGPKIVQYGANIDPTPDPAGIYSQLVTIRAGLPSVGSFLICNELLNDSACFVHLFSIVFMLDCKARNNKLQW